MRTSSLIVLAILLATLPLLAAEPSAGLAMARLDQARRLVNRHHRTHGTWPATLREDAPKDPATGGPLVYRRTASGFTLSVPDPRRYGLRTLEVGMTDDKVHWSLQAPEGTMVPSPVARFLQSMMYVKVTGESVGDYQQAHKKFPRQLLDVEVPMVPPAALAALKYEVAADGSSFLVEGESVAAGVRVIRFTPEAGLEFVEE